MNASSSSRSLSNTRAERRPYRRSVLAAAIAGAAPLLALVACSAAPDEGDSATASPDESLQAQCVGTAGNQCSCPPGETLHCTHYTSTNGCTQFQCMPGPPPPPPPPPCGLLGNACCPGDVCKSTATTCVSGTCESCGGGGQIACSGAYPCPGGVPANGVCVECANVADTNVSATAKSPTQATVSYNATAAYTNDVSLISTIDLSDTHSATGQGGFGASVVVSGLKPATTYWVTVGAGGSGDYCYKGTQTSTKVGLVDQDTVTTVRTLSGFDQSSLSVDPSSLAACPGSSCSPSIVFNPSAALAALVPSLANLKFSAPTGTIVTPSPLPNIQWWMDQLTATTDENNLVVTLGPNDVEFKITASGDIQFHGSGINGGVAIDPSTIDVHIGLDAAHQRFVVDSVVADIHHHVTGCVADPWLILIDPALAAVVDCGWLVESNLPDLNQMVHDAVMGNASSPGLPGIIGTPQVTLQAGRAFAMVLDRLSQTSAAFMPGTLAYGMNANTGAPALTFQLGFVTNAQTTVTTPAK